jgi:sulfate permease, SulP family
MHKRLEPKLISILREGYTRQQFYTDITAGITVGIVALPLAIAFAIASGVKPEQGLYTAIIAGVSIAILGGSRAQVSGPTGAFIVIIYGIVQQYGYNGLAVATLIAGALLILMGIAQMGALLKFIPYPVTVGFTSGIALVIFSSQIKDFLGLQMQSVPADFVHKWMAYKNYIHTFNPYSIMIAFISIPIIFLLPQYISRIPSPLIAIIVSTGLVHFFHLPVETIGSKFGSVPSHFPVPHIPHITWELITTMFSPAVTIALLAALESLLTAVVADGMLGTRHRSNMELIAQGVGNILSPLFNGIPATGAVARTATNIKNGGRTPIASLVHALVLLLIMLFFGQWAALIPMPALAAILVVVAYNMSEWHTFIKLLHSPRSDVVVLITTFLLTVFIDLTVAIQVGVVLAAFLFLQRMSNATQISVTTDNLSEEEEDPDRSISKLSIPPGVEVFDVYGSLFFGAIERFKEAIRRTEKRPQVIILRMRYVVLIDASGLQTLEDLLNRLQQENTALLLSGLSGQPHAVMQNAGFIDRIGKENVLENIEHALARARDILGQKNSE